MKCPACSEAMSTIQAGEINLDVCTEGCGGIWFDAGEVDKFDDGSEFDPQSLVTFTGSGKAVDQKAIRNCPRCPDEVLVRQFYDVPNKVEMNQCWNCSGIFLDRGELAILRSEFANDKEHSDAIEQYAQRCIDEQAAEMAQETKEWKAHYEATHATRFQGVVSALKILLYGGDE